MQRRQLLHSFAALAASATLPCASQVLAASKDAPRLLLVFLRGGYDCASLLVPTSSQFYYESRPNIAIARPSSGLEAALTLNSDWGLHPALRDSMLPLYNSGELAFMPFAGTDNLSRSHFETQDSIELGQPLRGRRDLNSGFLNRLAGNVGSIDAMAFTDNLPLIMQGKTQIANAGVSNPGRVNIDARQSNLIAQMYGGTALGEKVKEGFAVREEVAREMKEEMEAASRNAISVKGFEQEARRIAKLMRDKYAIGFIDVGGWDTHVNQGGATGALAGKLEQLGRGLALFQQEMGPQWRNTVTVVISEFGRTFRENGKRGTDHGHGSVFWVLGGSVKGGNIVGEQVQVSASTLFQNRDYPVLNDYRSVLGGLFARMYGLNAGQVENIFPTVKGRDWGLL
ncbi:MAG: DUF1501 domain-containing protein [Burkholderiales bacterium]|nr:DUF1501 domain-containing protein [Burkholderiales bacterium]